MLVFSYILSVALMILIPVVLAGLMRRRFQAPWLLFGIGSLTFIGSQVVHFPLNNLLTRLHILPQTGISDPSISLLQTCLVLGLTAGLCEEGARAVGYYFLRRFRSVEDGVMLGIGHGGIEAMVFGGVLTAATVSSLIPLMGTDLSGLNLNPDQAAVLTRQLQALGGSPIAAAAAPLVERLLAMVLHVILSVMVLEAFRRRSFFLVLAIVYHMLVDAGAVYLSTVTTNVALIHLAFAGSILPGAIWLIWLWRKELRPATAQNAPVGADLAAFWISLRKELLQQVRTRRFLVVMAVFVLFGLTSPLLAKYIPEILKSVAGAEQFASLVPTPTAADAMAQYIKNISQFGFMLAVLLGMNAVAGEKETGTAALVLSKPLPRWAFVLSKFAAQTLVYLAAFTVAGLGAYYYTVILFGGLDALMFGQINLLLVLWLLTFVGAALLGSVVGSSIAMAAGVGIGLSVAILLGGSIPQYGALFPGALMSWAAALGAGTASVPVNGGALAGSFVLIVMCLVWSVALFERQEI